MFYHERYAKKSGYSIIVGIDEAGRGPLAGPIVVAAVFLRSLRFESRIDDSKRLTADQRCDAFEEIVAKSEVGVGIIGEEIIDTIHIIPSLTLAADRALGELFGRLEENRAGPTLENTMLLFDGSLVSSLPHRSKIIEGGDRLSLSIASASIIAKVVRDRVMEVYDKIYPRYGFCDHKGYGTKRHLENISRYGLSPIHRRTFCSGIRCIR